MLVLTRKRNQSIVVNDNIEVTIIDIQGDQVRVGINAPKDVQMQALDILKTAINKNKK